jgi:hypothetical protein
VDSLHPYQVRVVRLGEEPPTLPWIAFPRNELTEVALPGMQAHLGEVYREARQGDRGTDFDPPNLLRPDTTKLR